MDEGTERFLRTFKVPRKEIEKMRETAAQTKIEDFREYEEMAKIIFDFFEEITGKSIQRSIMLENVSHYFEEGFSEDEMRDYIRDSLNDDYFKANPIKFTLANLFPLRDQERMNMVWDKLSHFQGLRMKRIKTLAGFFMTVKCGAKIPVGDIKAYEEHNAECFERKGKCFYP